MKRSNSPEKRNPIHLRSLSLSASILSCCSSLDRTGPPGAGLLVLLFLSTPEPPRSDLAHSSQVGGRNHIFVYMEIQIYPVRICHLSSMLFLRWCSARRWSLSELELGLVEREREGEGVSR